MKALLTTFKKDLTLSLRSFYIYLILIFALVFVFVIEFGIRDDAELSLPLVVALQDHPLLDELSSELNSENASSVIVMDSRQAVLDYLDEERSMQGMVIGYTDEKMTVEYIIQGYEHQGVANIVKAEIMQEARKDLGLDIAVTTTVLNPKAQKVPVKDLTIPIFLVTESALMGMFLVASYVFSEKQEGTVKAFCVTSAKVWHFVCSKVLVFLVFGLISAIVVVVGLLGVDYNILQTLLLIIVFNIFGTMLGLILAVFFDNLQNAMVWIILVAVVFGITTVSYLMPSFSPTVITVLPTYPMQFALKEALFPSGNDVYVWSNILGFLAIDVVLFMICNGLYKKRLSTF